jgi:hypothetical protein
MITGTIVVIGVVIGLVGYITGRISGYDKGFEDCMKFYDDTEV